MNTFQTMQKQRRNDKIVNRIFDGVMGAAIFAIIVRLYVLTLM